MTIELQNKVWSILPKEFKEEVKEIYLNIYLNAVEHHPCGYNHKTDLLKYLFGNHNLTSDAEGEETLICEKSKVQRAYNTAREIVKAENPDSLMYSMHTQIMCVLESIFGSKCLPDKLNEDNFAKSEPQLAEQKEEADKQFDNILKDSFRNKRRLNIAAQIVASMIGSDDWTTWRGGSNKEIWHNMAKSSLEIADALIAECEKKGGGNATE